MKSPRRKDSGFALLLVFLMAAVAGIMLYRELPRVAFQSQRMKEQMLIERGEEYKHAIRLFVRTNNNRWPASIDELESFNNRRFLRRRYKDPMTGKDEWRLIHIQNGILQDSVTNKKPDPNKQGPSNTGIVAEIPLTPTNAPAQGVSAANRRRPSDSAPQLGPDGQPMSGGLTAANVPGGFPGQQPGALGANGQPVMLGPNGQPVVLGPNGQPVVAGGQPVGIGVGGSGIPGMLGIPVAPNPNQSPSNLGVFGSAPTPTQGQPNPNGFPPGVTGLPPGVVPGQFTGNANGAAIAINPQTQAAAAGMIQQLLTSPRPGGLAGITNGQAGGMVGGGIAGVASNYDSESIMVYGDRTNYSEWEFIYDPSKFRPPPNPLQGTVGTTVSQLSAAQGNMPSGMAGTSVATIANGQQNGFGGIGGGVPGSNGGGLGGAPGPQGAAVPGAPGGGSSAFGGGGGVDIRPGRAY